jgi:hypothetical protein
MKTKIIFPCLIVILFSISSSGQEISPIPEKVNRDSSQKITREKLLEVKNAEYLLSSFPKNELEIVHFRLSVAGRGIPYAEFETTGNQFSLAMKKQIRLLPVRSKLFLEYIKYKVKNSTDNSVKIFPPASFDIVEK